MQNNKHHRVAENLRGISLVTFDGTAMNGASHCAYRKVDPGILVVQSAQDGRERNVPGPFDDARDLRILVQ
jgi:hypothetical protein